MDWDIVKWPSMPLGLKFVGVRTLYSARTDPELSLKEAAMDGLACPSCSIGALAEEHGYACCHCKAALPEADLKKMLQVKNHIRLKI